MRINHLTQVGAGAILLAGISFQSNAASTYSSGHGDIGVGYDAAAVEFEPHWHIGAGATVNGSPLAAEDEYTPVDMVALVTSTRLSPSGLSAGIGVPDGSTIRVAGSAAFQPNLGFAVEELDPSDWTGNITISLTSWNVPSLAAFAMYTTNFTGNSVSDLAFSTHNSVATFSNNRFEMTPGDHVHFQFGFTKPGDYDLGLTWTGMHAVDGAISTTDTFRLTVVPEPSNLVLSCLALGLSVLRRRR